jgi:hypothetical protein
VDVVNKAGHKFPSGYPARRAWLEVEFRHPETGELLWASGERTADGLEIAGVDELGLSNWEPHLDVIDSEDLVQIYEMVIADVTGAPTNVLERADVKLKDNRLVPLGFSLDHAVYDTTTIAGAEVMEDALNGNFNRDESGQTGTGSDRVRYLADLTESYSESAPPVVTVRMWYQSMPPRWVNPMFEVSGEAIDWFESVFLDYAHPDLVAEVVPEVSTVKVPELQPVRGRIWPVPSSTGQITVETSLPAGVPYEVYDTLGQRVQAGRTPGSRFMLMLPATKQVYTVVVHGAGESWTGRAIRD